ncbi:hypothetical protein [Pseudomonas sp. MMS21 TM103]|uniref:hypothetical protein n=1 Tax=Pseudomonas sp. MMS21 TM103 TaxID=2886506 RepID=UPI003FA73BDA
MLRNDHVRSGGGSLAAGHDRPTPTQSRLSRKADTGQEWTVISFLDPNADRGAPVDTAKFTRKPRDVKIYKNPITGADIETKCCNHRQLKEWKTEFGADVIDVLAHSARPVFI